MISKTGIHAAMALALLARLAPGEYAGAASIAREIGAPQNYLGKLLKGLAGQGLVESQKGFGGGFRLARSPKKISLFDVVEPIDKVSRWGDCFLGRKRCHDDDPCAVHREWSVIRKQYLEFLKGTSIEDLAEKKVSLPA
jgi:Rrf2 family protein